jgi:hypothetical protein
LTDEIDTHLEARLKSMDETFQRTKDDLAEIAPRIDAVKKGLGEVENAVSDGFVHALQVRRAGGLEDVFPSLTGL